MPQSRYILSRLLLPALLAIVTGGCSPGRSTPAAPQRSASSPPIRIIVSDTSVTPDVVVISEPPNGDDHLLLKVALALVGAVSLTVGYSLLLRRWPPREANASAFAAEIKEFSGERRT